MIIGSLFCLNLALAVIEEKFSKTSEEEEEKEQDRARQANQEADEEAAKEAAMKGDVEEGGKQRRIDDKTVAGEDDEAPVGLFAHFNKQANKSAPDANDLVSQARVLSLTTYHRMLRSSDLWPPPHHHPPPSTRATILPRQCSHAYCSSSTRSPAGLSSFA